MLSAYKANESEWILSLTFVSIISVLWDHNAGQGHLRSPGKEGLPKKNRDLELRCMLLGQTFAKNAKNDHTTF